MASVLGLTFSLSEIIAISEHVLSISDEEGESSHKKTMMVSLDLACQAGIIVQSVIEEEDPIFNTENYYSGDMSPMLVDEEKVEFENTRIAPEDISYMFCHDTWRQKILSLLLDAYKQDIHRHAARAIESKIADIEECDYRTKMRLFTYLKEGGDRIKAAKLAIDLGKNFKNLGLNTQSVEVYNSALNIWQHAKEDKPQDIIDTSIADMSGEVIESLDEYDLTLIVRLLTVKGQALGTISKKTESSQAFEDALEVSI